LYAAFPPSLYAPTIWASKIALYLCLLAFCTRRRFQLDAAIRLLLVVFIAILLRSHSSSNAALLYSPCSLPVVESLLISYIVFLVRKCDFIYF
jgi:hypothetical protein